MKTPVMMTVATVMLLLAGSCCLAESTFSKDNLGRKLKGYNGCSSGSWGSVCTKDYGNGTSSTCTETPYYSGCSYYPTGHPHGRKLLADNEERLPETVSFGRALKAYHGCSSGSWGSVCTTDHKNGTSTICTHTPYYNGCSTYPNGEALLQNGGAGK